MPQSTMETTEQPLIFRAPPELKQFEFEGVIRGALAQANRRSIADIRGRACVFDLSKCQWYDLGCLLWLLTLLHKLKRDQSELRLLLPDLSTPKMENLWDFLVRWRFFDALRSCVDDPVNLLRPEQLALAARPSKYAPAIGHDEFGDETLLYSSKLLEITTIPVSAEQNKPVDEFLVRFNDKLIVGALSGLCGWNPLLTKQFVQHVVGEGLHNSVMHAGGTFSLVGMRRDKRNLTIAIADNGVGIPSVLRAALAQNSNLRDVLSSSDADLIKYFTDPQLIMDSRWISLSVQRGVSSRQERKGLGLYYLKSTVLSAGGEVRIRSGTACVDFSQSGDTVKDGMTESPGTMMRIRTPLKV